MVQKANYQDNAFLASSCAFFSLNQIFFPFKNKTHGKQYIFGEHFEGMDAEYLVLAK